MNPPNVAVLGLGLMGSGMAQRILGAGFPLAVYNRSRDKTEALGAAGARVADSPRDAASGADVVLSMIERGGLDRPRAVEVLTGGAPGSPLVKAVAGRMTGPDYSPHFFLRLMAKDLTYAIQEAAGQSLDLTTAAAALAAFQRAIAAGHGEQDLSAVVEPLRRR